MNLLYLAAGQYLNLDLVAAIHEIDRAEDTNYTQYVSSGLNPKVGDVVITWAHTGRDRYSCYSMQSARALRIYLDQWRK